MRFVALTFVTYQLRCRCITLTNGEEMSIHLKKLRHIVAVARAENITLAAETVGITQSALTRSIAEVEGEFGVKLFERLPRGVRVTPVGQVIIHKARLTLSNFDDLVASVTDYRDLNSGRLRVGFTPSIFERFVSGQSLEFITKHPGMSFESIPGTVHDLVPMAIAGQIDLVVGGSFQLNRWAELKRETFADLQCDILVRKGHPLTAIEEVGELDVLKYPLVQPASMGELHSDIEQAYIRNNMTAKRGQYVSDDYVIVKRIVLATDAFTPLLGLKGDVRYMDDRFDVIENAMNFSPQQLVVAHALNSTLSPAASQYMDILLNSMAWQKSQSSAEGLMGGLDS